MACLNCRTLWLRHHGRRPSRYGARVAQDAGEPATGGYRRFGGSSRGHARRLDLLARVTDVVQVNGLADFSLRRAARAAGTTHKVLLYYFHDADELLAEAVAELRRRRIARPTTPVDETGPASFFGRR